MYSIHQVHYLHVHNSYIWVITGYVGDFDQNLVGAFHLCLFHLHKQMISSISISQSVLNILICCVTENMRLLLLLSLLRYNKMTVELITFNHSIIWAAILVQQHWELELVHESQLGEVQIKRPKVWFIKKRYQASHNV